MSVRVTVEIPGRRYDVSIGRGLLERVGRTVAPLFEGARVALVTDSHVGPLFADVVAESLREPGFDVDVITIPAGESSKSWAVAGEVVERLAELGLDRTDAVIALGGGVVGDLAGFCAAVYLRGIAFAQVPTTLLAQVDSSVGGKTGVDLTAGKNLAGAFIQPAAVIADTGTLESLPEHEWRSGLAEIAKSAVLDGEGFLGWLELHAREMMSRQPDAVQEAVRASVAFKGRVVASDERESGDRESLNLGHTLGHAIERVAGYGIVPHGLAVAEGMRFAARLAVRVAGADPGFCERQERLLDALGLTRRTDSWDTDALRLAMSADKKARGGTPRFVLPTAPGSFVVTTVDESLIAEEMRAWARGESG